MTAASKILVGIIVAIVVAGFVLGVVGFFKGSSEFREDLPSDEAVLAFQNELSNRALERGPHPVEGFDAFMLLDIFPGLQEQDFIDVQTGGGREEGRYTFEDRELKWGRTANQPITSAEQTISPEGYKMFLRNLSQRLAMATSNEEEVIAIIDAVDIPSDLAEHIAAKRDLILVYSPRPFSAVSSPLAVWGEARGQWYFEADFQLTLTDWDGRIIAQSFASAQDDWMTENFVPFMGTIDFENPAFPGVNEEHFSRRGTLIFHKANPSGLPERDDALEIPILFE